MRAIGDVQRISFGEQRMIEFRLLATSLEVHTCLTDAWKAHDNFCAGFDHVHSGPGAGGHDVARVQASAAKRAMIG